MDLHSTQEDLNEIEIYEVDDDSGWIFVRDGVSLLVYKVNDDRYGSMELTFDWRSLPYWKRTYDKRLLVHLLSI